MIRSTCGYLRKDGQWLMLLRNRKENDVNKGKWIGPGGKFEAGEDAETCMKRELLEETGLTADRLKYEGLIYFRYPHKEEEKIWIYTCDAFHGELQPCSEGTLAWIREEDILSLNLWEGDRIFLKHILQKQTGPFCYELIYNAEDELVSFQNLEA